MSCYLFKVLQSPRTVRLLMVNGKQQQHVAKFKRNFANCVANVAASLQKLSSNTIKGIFVKTQLGMATYIPSNFYIFPFFLLIYFFSLLPKFAIFFLFYTFSPALFFQFPLPHIHVDDLPTIFSFLLHFRPLQPPFPLTCCAPVPSKGGRDP